MKIPRDFGRVLLTPRRVGSMPRAARAYLAGFGTSGSLLAVAVLLFIVASALVAFRGWPHVAAQPSPGEVVVSPRPTAATSSVAARRLVAISAPAVGAGAPAIGAGAGGAGGAGRGLSGPAAPGTRRSIGAPASASLPAGTPASTVGGALPAGGSQPAPACLTGCGHSSPVPSAPAPVEQLQQSAQQAVQQATGTLGNVVSGTGSQLGGAVQQTTNTAAGAVQPVSPPAAAVIKNTGTGAGNVIGGATKTAAGALSAIGSGH